MVELTQNITSLELFNKKYIELMQEAIHKDAEHKTQYKNKQSSLHTKNLWF